MGRGRTMSGSVRARRWIALATIVTVVAAACGGGDSEGGTSQGTIQGDTVVVDEEQLAAARAELEAEEEGEEPEIASAAETDVDALADDGESGEAGEEDGIEVAEADEDELDGLLNAVTLFNQCLDDEGYEFMGAPGQDGASPDDFEQGYLQALGACAAESNIVASLQAFGEAQAKNRSSVSLLSLGTYRFVAIFSTLQIAQPKPIKNSTAVPS